MYGIGASRSRFKLCRLALCMSRFSQLYANSERAIIDLADQSVPNLGFCTNPSSNLANLARNPISNPQLTTNPSSSAGSGASFRLRVKERIWAVERLSKGKRFAEHDRMQYRIPGYVVDLTNPELEHVLVLVDKFQIQSLLLSMGEGNFLVTVFTLEVFDGHGSLDILYELPVLPRRINYDKGGDICNIGFVKTLPGAKMKLDSPIFIFGEESCIGVKKGGFLKVHTKYVSFFCSAEELHPYVTIDVTNMDIGDRVCLGDLNLEAQLHSSNESSLVVCEVVDWPPRE